MAFSKYTLLGDGATTQFAVNFTLGFLDRTDVTVQVGGEVDGSSDPVYRALTWITDGLVDLGGTVPANLEEVVFRRDVDATVLEHDYEAGASITEANLDESHKQAIMLVHQVLDGRFEGQFEGELDMGSNRITSVGDPVNAQDAATKAWTEAAYSSGVDAGAAQTAAEAAQALAEQAVIDAAAEVVLAAAEVTNAQTEVTNAAAQVTLAEAQVTLATAQAVLADVSKMTWLGAYAGGTAYILNDVVSYLGSTYINILAGTGNLPTNVTYWEVVASKGDQGIQGDAGTDGTDGVDTIIAVTQATYDGLTPAAGTLYGITD